MSLKLILKDKKFSPLFWTQFFGALNDNLFKNALVMMITFQGIIVLGLKSDLLVALAGGVFILPFFLFSPLAGQLSDKFQKAQIAKMTKVLELVIMMVASVGFYFESYEMLLVVLFFMGLQSALFGPVKYSIIPELVEEEALTEGNAYIETGTFVAILLGTIGGGLAAGAEGAKYLMIFLLISVSLIGLFTSLFLPSVRVASPGLKLEYNPFPKMIDLLGLIRKKKVLFNSVLAISWFWFFGAGILSVLPEYCKTYLGVDARVATTFFAMFTVGIGVGSILCEKLSNKRVEIGLVPLGSLGMTMFLADLYFILPAWPVNPDQLISLSEFFSYFEGKRLLFDFLMMSVFGGIFTLPLYTLLQERSEPESRSQVIAANNIMNAVFMVGVSVLIMVSYSAGFNAAEILFGLAVLNILVASYIYMTVPEFTLRFITWVLTHILYRVRTRGLSNIPKLGPCILVSNHVSFIDWLIIAGLCRRPCRFVIYYKFFDIPFVRYLLRQAKVIPIAGEKEDPQMLKQAYERITYELDQGEVVCIFPEGEITQDGQLGRFRPGIIKIIEKNPVPVIPIAITGLWGSFFSRKKGRALSGVPSIKRRKIELRLAPPIMPGDVSLQTLQSNIVAMGSEQ